MSSGESGIDVVDSLLVGFMTSERAAEIAAKFPSVADDIVDCIKKSWAAQNWSRVERLANLAAQLRPPGLGEVLRQLFDADITEINQENMVDILGEIRGIGLGASKDRTDRCGHDDGRGGAGCAGGRED